MLNRISNQKKDIRVKDSQQQSSVEIKLRVRVGEFQELLIPSYLRRVLIGTEIQSSSGKFGINIYIKEYYLKSRKLFNKSQRLSIKYSR